MRRLSLSVLLFLLSAGALLAQGSSGKPDPKIVFEEAAVTASGLTPGKTVVWFGVGHQQAAVAQQAVSGYTFVSQANSLNRSLTGNIVGTHQKGS